MPVSRAKAPTLAVTGSSATFTALKTTWNTTATRTLPPVRLTSYVSWTVRASTKT